MTLLLAGDIGGTKTILRLTETTDSPGFHEPADSHLLRNIYEESFHSQDFPDLVPIVQQFLAKAKSSTPQKACFAIAGPVVNNTANALRSRGQ